MSWKKKIFRAVSGKSKDSIHDARGLEILLSLLTINTSKRGGNQVALKRPITKKGGGEGLILEIEEVGQLRILHFPSLLGRSMLRNGREGTAKM